MFTYDCFITCISNVFSSLLRLNPTQHNIAFTSHFYPQIYGGGGGQIPHFYGSRGGMFRLSPTEMCESEVAQEDFRHILLRFLLHFFMKDCGKKMRYLTPPPPPWMHRPLKAKCHGQDVLIENQFVVFLDQIKNNKTKLYCTLLWSQLHTY